MIRAIKEAIKRFIVDAIINDYLNNGRTRTMVALGGKLERQRVPPMPPLSR